MTIWALKEDKISPEYQVDQILVKNAYRYQKISKSLQNKSNFVEKDLAIYKNMIVNE